MTPFVYSSQNKMTSFVYSWVGIENNVSQLDSFFLFHCLVCGAVLDGNHVHVHVAVPCRYSVAYFDRIAVFEAPYCRTLPNGGAHTWFIDA